MNHIKFKTYKRRYYEQKDTIKRGRHFSDNVTLTRSKLETVSTCRGTASGVSALLTSASLSLIVMMVWGIPTGEAFLLVWSSSIFLLELVLEGSPVPGYISAWCWGGRAWNRKKWKWGISRAITQPWDGDCVAFTPAFVNIHAMLRYRELPTNTVHDDSLITISGMIKLRDSW